MAIIRSGASTDQLTIDPTSKAARVTRYDAAGRELYPKPTGAYMAPINIRNTAATAAGAAAVVIRGPAQASPLLKMYIRNIRGTIGFDGTALAASATLRMGLYRGQGVTTASGGTAITAANITKKDSTFGSSTILDYRYDATGVGLTTTGITFDADPIHVFSLSVIQLQVAVPTTSASAGPVMTFDLDYHTAARLGSNLVIGPDQHLALRLQTVAAVIGFGIYGSIAWEERV